MLFDQVTPKALVQFEGGQHGDSFLPYAGLPSWEQDDELSEDDERHQMAVVFSAFITTLETISFCTLAGGIDWRIKRVDGQTSIGFPNGRPLKRPPPPASFYPHLETTMDFSSAQIAEKISSLNEVQAITEKVHLSFSSCGFYYGRDSRTTGLDERMKFLFKNLVDHIHNFVRETSLTHAEWSATMDFLDRFRQEDRDIAVMSDILGVSALVDLMNSNKPPNATEDAVLGPLYTENTQILKNGDSIASEGKGDYLMDVWEADQHGVYDMQRSDYNDKPDCRGRFTTGEDGVFAFRAVKPSSYQAAAAGGPVIDLLNALNTHKYRPAHLHSKIVAPNYMELVT
ncbi:aromatic compound dioxygenase [Armillaria gallica]|uniref:Aromatic compound dioxygenase n=1 Tax=Armillaria gallica TaxID=47427 RepID=A0A2H3E0U8_ARMGA|nr:aromatic compound dioxygenase [Armillaria gallica]